MINIPNFTLTRSDRIEKRGGGVALYFDSRINVTTLDKPECPHEASNFDYLATEITTGKKSIRVICFYIPPDSSNCSSTMQVVCQLINHFLIPNKPFFLIGDFNHPHIDWTHSTSSNPNDMILLDLYSDLSLTQFINQSTHKDGNVLDLLFTNLPGQCVLLSHEVESPITSTCDHSSVVFTLAGKLLTQNSKQTSYHNFRLADYDRVNEKLAMINWNFLYDNSLSFQTKYNTFIDLILEVINETVPLKYIKSNRKYKRPKPLQRLLNKKLKCYKLVKCGKMSKGDYSKVASEYESAVQAIYDKHDNAMCSNPNNRKLYSYVKKKLNCDFLLPPLLNSEGESVSSDYLKAKLLNETFQKSFSSDDCLPFISHQLNIPLMPHFQINSSDILSAINSKDKISRTPEKIPSFFIKRVSQSLIIPLTYLYNFSLTSNVIPYQWKSSLITPVFKKGSRKVPSNYRPIAQTSSFCRILESILFDQILAHLQTNSILSENQFGFIPHKSSCSQLLVCIHSWLSSFSNNNSTYVAYTDISKAFDSLNHRKLIHILTSIQLHNPLVAWIRNYLGNRTQRVVVNSVFSPSVTVASGIPQGSILGPLLFIIYMNDIITSPEISDSNSTFILFADDTKVFSTDLSNIQSSLSDFSSKLKSYQLQLAPHKCAILPFSKTPFDSLVQSLPSVTINSIDLPYIDSIKDLGIYVSSNFKWEKHISKIVNLSLITSYQILKTFKTKNIWTLMKLYKTYIRPKLEYNTPIWNPYLLKNINTIESVQRRFTKIVCRRCSIVFNSYQNRLEKLKILSLQDRRIRNDLLLMFKILRGLSDISFSSYFKIQTSPYSLRGGETKIVPLESYSSPAWINSFFNRAPKYFNKLPPEISSARSLQSFKLKLKKLDFNCLKQQYL